MLKALILFIGLFGLIGGLYFFFRTSTMNEIKAGVKGVLLVVVITLLAAFGVNVATSLGF